MEAKCYYTDCKTKFNHFGSYVTHLSAMHAKPVIYNGGLRAFYKERSFFKTTTESIFQCSHLSRSGRDCFARIKWANGEIVELSCHSCTNLRRIVFRPMLVSVPRRTQNGILHAGVEFLKVDDEEGKETFLYAETGEKIWKETMEYEGIKQNVWHKEYDKDLIRKELVAEIKEKSNWQCQQCSTSGVYSSILQHLRENHKDTTLCRICKAEIQYGQSREHFSVAHNFFTKGREEFENVLSRPFEDNVSADKENKDAIRQSIGREQRRAYAKCNDREMLMYAIEYDAKNSLGLANFTLEHIKTDSGFASSFLAWKEKLGEDYGKMNTQMSELAHLKYNLRLDGDGTQPYNYEAIGTVGILRSCKHGLCSKWTKGNFCKEHALNMTTIVFLAMDEANEEKVVFHYGFVEIAVPDCEMGNDTLSGERVKNLYQEDVWKAYCDRTTSHIPKMKVIYHGKFRTFTSQDAAVVHVEQYVLYWFAQIWTRVHPGKPLEFLLRTAIMERDLLPYYKKLFNCIGITMSWLTLGDVEQVTNSVYKEKCSRISKKVQQLLSKPDDLAKDNVYYLEDDDECGYVGLSRGGTAVFKAQGHFRSAIGQHERATGRKMYKYRRMVLDKGAKMEAVAILVGFAALVFPPGNGQKIVNYEALTRHPFLTEGTEEYTYNIFESDDLYVASLFVFGKFLNVDFHFPPGEWHEVIVQVLMKCKGSRAPVYSTDMEYELHKNLSRSVWQDPFLLTMESVIDNELNAASWIVPYHSLQIRDKAQFAQYYREIHNSPWSFKEIIKEALLKDVIRLHNSRLDIYLVTRSTADRYSWPTELDGHFYEQGRRFYIEGYSFVQISIDAFKCCTIPEASTNEIQCPTIAKYEQNELTFTGLHICYPEKGWKTVEITEDPTCSDRKSTNIEGKEFLIEWDSVTWNSDKFKNDVVFTYNGCKLMKRIFVNGSSAWAVSKEWPNIDPDQMLSRCSLCFETALVRSHEKYHYDRKHSVEQMLMEEAERYAMDRSENVDEIVAKWKSNPSSSQQPPNLLLAPINVIIDDSVQNTVCIPAKIKIPGRFIKELLVQDVRRNLNADFRLDIPSDDVLEEFTDRRDHFFSSLPLTKHIIGMDKESVFFMESSGMKFYVCNTVHCDNLGRLCTNCEVHRKNHLLVAVGTVGQRLIVKIHPSSYSDLLKISEEFRKENEYCKILYSHAYARNDSKLALREYYAVLMFVYIAAEAWKSAKKWTVEGRVGLRFYPYSAVQAVGMLKQFGWTPYWTMPINSQVGICHVGTEENYIYAYKYDRQKYIGSCTSQTKSVRPHAAVEFDPTSRGKWERLTGKPHSDYRAMLVTGNALHYELIAQISQFLRFGLHPNDVDLLVNQRSSVRLSSLELFSKESLKMWSEVAYFLFGKEFSYTLQTTKEDLPTAIAEVLRNWKFENNNNFASHPLLDMESEDEEDEETL